MKQVPKINASTLDVSLRSAAQKQSTLTAGSRTERKGEKASDFLAVTDQVSLTYNYRDQK